MLATLLVEIVDTRLLAVITWYHLSFVATSVAMLGSAAGAVVVFVSPSRFPWPESVRRLAVWAGRFAIVVAVSHLLSLGMPVPSGAQWAVMDLVVLTRALGVFAAPFVFVGVVTTLALTRVQAPVGNLVCRGPAGRRGRLPGRGVASRSHQPGVRLCGDIRGCGEGAVLQAGDRDARWRLGAADPGGVGPRRQVHVRDRTRVRIRAPTTCGRPCARSAVPTQPTVPTENPDTGCRCATSPAAVPMQGFVAGQRLGTQCSEIAETG